MTNPPSIVICFTSTPAAYKVIVGRMNLDFAVGVARALAECKGLYFAVLSESYFRDRINIGAVGPKEVSIFHILEEAPVLEWIPDALVRYRQQ